MRVYVCASAVVDTRSERDLRVCVCVCVAGWGAACVKKIMAGRMSVRARWHVRCVCFQLFFVSIGFTCAQKVSHK